ncbi:Nucleolar protein 12 [Coemansia sp. Benny D115]|nr:Nucleolar protein 12 [Coemansia sp. Benny D115]
MAELKQGELSKLLVGGAKSKVSINSAVDDLFKNAPAPAPAPVAVKAVPKPVFKKEPEDVEMEDTTEPTATKKVHKKKARKAAEREQQAKADGAKPAAKSAAEAAADAAAEAEENEIKAAKAKRARQVGFGLDADIEGEEDEEEVRKRSKKASMLGRMHQDPEKLKRTIFIGNITVECITNNQTYKDLKNMCAEHGKVVSLRFRSIAFSELLPRKAAFIMGKFHSKRDACNAYVEYATDEAAASAVKMNGTVFQDKHIRVDLASNSKKHDMKRSVFVGNLDFAAQEEDLWRHFETCGTVENVRIIRDPKTSIGKGFGYVQFADRAALSLALKLNGTEVNSRKLRVERGSEKIVNDKKLASGAPITSGSLTKLLDETRSVKGDKPSSKKRRTARSADFAKKRASGESIKPAGASSGSRDTGSSRGGRGGSRGGSGGFRGGRGGAAKRR